MCYIIHVIVAASDTQCLRGVDPPRKPLPQKKIPQDLRSLARGYAEMCVRTLAGIVSQEAIPPAARVSAASALLERGWGKAAQPHTGEDDKAIEIILRNITESFVKNVCEHRFTQGVVAIGDYRVSITGRVKVP